MLRNNIKQLKNSETFQTILNSLPDRNFAPDKEIADRIEFFCAEQLTVTEKRLLNYMIFVCRRFKITYVKQATIAHACNQVSRETINRLLRKLARLNLIKIINRGVKRTCVYLVSRFLLRYDIRRKLRPILAKGPLVLFPTWTLLSVHYPFENKLQIKNVTQEKVNSYITSYFTTCTGTVCNLHSHSTKKEERRLEQFKQESSLVADYVTKLRLPLTLTAAGQLKLSAFPAGAIKAIQLEANHGRKINQSSSFGVLYKIAAEWCKNNDLRPDWEWYDAIKIKYQIEADTPMVERKTFIKREEKRPSYGSTPSLDVKKLIQQWYHERHESRITPGYAKRRIVSLLSTHESQAESVNAWLASEQATDITAWLGEFDQTSSEQFRNTSFEEKMIIAQKNVIAFRRMSENHPSIHNLATLFGTDLARAVFDAIRRRWEDELARLNSQSAYMTARANEDGPGSTEKREVV